METQFFQRLPKNPSGHPVLIEKWLYFSSYDPFRHQNVSDIWARYYFPSGLYLVKLASCYFHLPRKLLIYDILYMRNWSCLRNFVSRTPFIWIGQFYYSFVCGKKVIQYVHTDCGLTCLLCFYPGSKKAPSNGVHSLDFVKKDVGFNVEIVLLLNHFVVDTG